MPIKRMKISFYTDTYLPAVDGVVSSIRESKRELESRGHTVFLITSGNSETRKMAAREKNIIVTPSIRFKKYPQYNLSVLPFIDIAKVKSINSDIVHVHTPFVMGTYGIISGRIKNVPVVWTFHTMFMDKETINQYAPGSAKLKKFVKKHSWSYIKFIANRCDTVIAPSNAIKQMLNKKGIKNTVIVPSGVDTNRFRRGCKGSAALRKRLLGREKAIVLYVGRLSKEKNLETLLKAAKLLEAKPIRFVVVGDGPYAETIRNKASRMGLVNVVFIGKVIKELPSYYNAADLLCLPSTFETQGIVCIEAMACGKPVVGADYLALKEIIKNGKNGERFRPKNAKDCARKIEKVINNIRLYKECESTAKRYSISVVTDQLLSLYGDLIKSKSEKPTWKRG
jgi:1,2-diacylglycerol 3-alpha-glucosyltransferase